MEEEEDEEEEADIRVVSDRGKQEMSQGSTKQRV